MRFKTQMVPPPAEVPVDQIAETLGLLPGLRAEKDRSGGRCGNCHQFRTDAWLIWVPDTASLSDSAQSISEQCRMNAFNGHSSGWCLQCARGLGMGKEGAPDDTIQPAPPKPRRSLLRRLWDAFGETGKGKP
jgi:hypothetical protein